MFINLNKFKTSSVSKAISSLFLDFTATNTLDDRVTFSRTSNATVTNSAGLVTYAPHNLLTFSEQFDNAAWTKNATTISANTTVAPNEALTADSFVENTANTVHFLSRTIGVTSGVSYTFTLFAKTNGRNFALFATGSLGGNFGRGFDLTNGTLLAAGNSYVNAPSSSMTSIGNGWYRCSITVNANTTGNTDFGFWTLDSNGSGSYTGNGTSGIFIWGAQLEIGSTASTYNPTTVKNLLGFTEAFDNAAWTKSSSFVQTNLLTYSQDFDNAAWSKTRSTVTANASVAPDNTTTMDKLVDTAVAGTHWLGFSATTIASTNYTASIYLKAGERTRAQLSIISATTPFEAITVDINLTAGTIGTPVANNGAVLSGATITNIGNGIYRVTVAGNIATKTNMDVRVFLADATGATSYTGDGTSGLFIWGAQLVQGAVAGDYRRTDAAALPVFYPNQDGVVCAEKLVENATANIHLLQSVGTLSTGIFTGSVYLKKAERIWASLQMGATAGSTGTAYFNLDTGVVGNVTAGYTASILNVGNGWYRCSITGTAATSASTLLGVFVSTGNGAQFYTGDGSSGIYIFGAQLSDSASLDPYVLNAAAAPTAAAYYGARFDYDPVTLQPKGLLIEEQRTNLALRSEEFDNSAWNALSGALVVTPNTTIAPDGNLTADSIALSSSFKCQGITVTASVAYTFSVWLKTDSGTKTVRIAELNGSGGITVTVTTSWQRFTLPYTATTTSSFVGIDQRSGSFSQSGTLFIWGAQLEAGAFATSYIPTVASQVTRTADNASIVGSNFYSWYNQNEGTLYASYIQPPTVLQQQTIVLMADELSVYAQRIELRANNASTTARTYINSASGVAACDFYFSPIFAGSNNKIVIGYATNDFASTFNAQTVQTDTSGNLPPTIAVMKLGALGSTNYLNSTIKQISYYKTRLPNSTLQSITS